MQAGYSRADQNIARWAGAGPSDHPINPKGDPYSVSTSLLRAMGTQGGKFVMARKTTHVVPDGHGGWNVKQGGAKRAAANFENKQDAVDRGRQISRNQRTELVIHNRDGKISEKDSHGRDPYPPRG